LRLKNELPTTKRVRSASFKLAAGKENALRPLEYTVVLPPGCASAAGRSNKALGASEAVGLGADWAVQPAKTKAAINADPYMCKGVIKRSEFLTNTPQAEACPHTR
jgi:hypothetical protein